MLRVLDLRERTSRGKRSHHNLVSAIKFHAARDLSIEFAPITDGKPRFCCHAPEYVWIGSDAYKQR